MMKKYGDAVFVCFLCIWTYGLGGNVLFRDSFDGGVIDPNLWTVAAFTGCHATIESNALKLFYIGSNNINPGVTLTSPIIDLPENWSKITLRGRWWWQSGTTGEFYIKLFEAGSEAGNYFRPGYAAWQGPKFCPLCSGGALSCIVKPWPSPADSFEMTITPSSWTFMQGGEVYATEPTAQMASVQQVVLKLGAWDYSALTNVAFFDEIELSVEVQPSCPPQSIYSQMPHANNEVFSGYLNDPLYSSNSIWMDNFPDTHNTICGVRWWGLRVSPEGDLYASCQPDPACQDYFVVSLYADKNGQPDLDTGWEFCVYPTMIDTGADYQIGPFDLGNLYEYTGYFPPVPSAMARWISIRRGAGEVCGSDCMFAWLSSSEGDGLFKKVTVGFPNTVETWSGDLSFCLLTAPDRFSNLEPCLGSRRNPLQPHLQWQFDQPEGTLYDVYIDDYGSEPMNAMPWAENLTETNWLCPYVLPERSHLYWRILAKTGGERIWSPVQDFYTRSNLGDLTDDTIVKMDDLQQIVSHWLNDTCGSCSDWCDGADLDYSSTVTIEDLAIFAEHWYDNYMVNDDCSEAEPMSLGVSIIVDTQNATGTDMTACGTNDSRDLWYKFTAPSDGTYSFQANSLYTNNCAAAAVFDACNGTQLGCAVSSKVFLSLPAVIDLSMTAGQTYYLRLSVENNATEQCTVVVYRK